MRRATFAGLAIGCVIGLGGVLAIGAAGLGRAYPRYSVSVGSALTITDNDEAKLFIYRNETDRQGEVIHRLHHVIDLSKVGQQELRPVEAKGR